MIAGGWPHGVLRLYYLRPVGKEPDVAGTRGTFSPISPTSANSYRDTSVISIEAWYAVPLGKTRNLLTMPLGGGITAREITSAVPRAMRVDLHRSL